ncbi:PREDICTED: XK-related protein 6-like [Papilio polytes]|uniref:XK-related protein 6-like n=1 Tax=Papilio polytes TaxID=76194 RepID=UPI000675E5F4|nr:PREDICTED: XK-related protein 6-like [Papilio polytes]
MAEFLPLCDVLFNVISLAGYFCDVVFDVVMGYALLERGYKCTFAATISIVVTSLLISQVLSLRWYLHVWWAGEGRKGRQPWLPIMLHCLQVGVLWRYARLLVPVELRRVKHQVRDLCMLRLVHAFCEAAPMLLLQLHILFKDTSHEPLGELGVTPEPSIDEPSANRAFAELNVISASLSLFSVCWALASFSKNVRLQNVHRLVLTWLGVIFQFLWRLGTISARICALTVYALVYEYWVFLVIGLHWVSMFLWLLSPRNVFHGERISRPRKAYLSALIAFVYVFAYINLQELNHRQKMVIFYCVMCVENWVLVCAWWWSGRAARPAPAAAAAAAAFCAGLAFMLLYYRYFHVRRLGYMLGENRQGTNSTNASNNKNGDTSTPTENAAIPGVFNCRFSNPVNNSAANGRKKKKPTTFVPPPAAPTAGGATSGAGKKAEQRKMQRCRTPEILLAPHYLETCTRPVCCHWSAPYTNRKKEEVVVPGAGLGSSGEESGADAARDTPRPPSDIDSQISLPRSYTLPREFRYWRRRPRLRDAHLPSNNSSDGDVDSGDNSSRQSECSGGSQPAAGVRPERAPDRRRRPHARHKPETDL